MTHQIPTFATRKLPDGMMETYRVFEIPVVKIANTQVVANSSDEITLREKRKN